MPDFDDRIISKEPESLSAAHLSSRAADLLFADAFGFPSPSSLKQSENKSEKAVNGTERTEARPERSETKAGKPRDQWTMVVQLQSEGADGARKLDELKQPNSIKIAKELKQLAAESKGKPVTIIVQCPGSENGQLERYAIRDGKVNKLDGVKSEGIAKDFQNLLQFSTKNYPSEKLGALLHVHGGGNLGIYGNGGEKEDNPSVQKLADSIKSGLQGSGHAKLDLLNFDSCVMGQNGVLSKLQGLADHIVASEQPEQYANTPKGSGQNIGGVLKALLANPKIDGDKLADRFVAEAKKQDNTPDAPDPPNPSDKVVPIQTLAHFDLSAYPRFQGALNNLGSELIKAMNSEKNRKAIKDIIGKTRHMDELNDTEPSSSASESFRGTRDLKDFTRKLLKAIDEGKLQADPKLKQATLALMSAQDGLVKSFYGHRENKEFGGLSVYLPEKATLDLDRIAAFWLPDGRLARHSATRTESLRSPQEREKLVDKLKDDVITSRITAEDNTARNKTRADEKTMDIIKELESQLKKLEKNLDNPEGFNKALKDLHKTARELSNTEFFRALRKDARQDAANSIQRQLISGGDWQRFREKLLSFLN